MVAASLSIGALVGVLLYGGFVWWEVGRYATPQVPVTLFDERRELFAYTAGLFVGVPLALAALLYLDSMANAALIGAALFLGLLVIGTEVAQWALLRTRFWGVGESRPFYALGYRSAIGGILTLAIIAQYLGGPSFAFAGFALVLLQSVAIVALEVAGSLLSMPPRSLGSRSGGGPVSGAIVQALGFFLLGIGPLGGQASGFASALLAIAGAGLVYRRLRPALASIPPPTEPPKVGPTVPRPAYGRTRGKAAEPPKG